MFPMPPMPPELLALLAKGNAAGAPGAAPTPSMNSVPGAPGAFGPPAPIQMGPGGVNLRPPMAGTPPITNAPGTNVPMVSPSPDAMAATFGRSKPPQSSDDPGITGMPELPKPPDLSNTPVTSAYQTYQADAAKQAALKAPRPEDFKPTWKDRLGGGLIGALSGGLSGNPDKGTAIGSRFTNRKFNTAQGDYSRQASTLDKQLEAERGGFPIAEAAGKIPQTDFENKFEVAKEGREQKTATANAEFHNDLTNIKQQMADIANTKESDQKEMALNKLAQDLELKSKGLDLKQMSLDQQRQLNELGNQLKEEKMANDRARYATGTDAKSLEDERKARLTAIENDWKQHPYWNKLTGNKTKEIAAVNDEINGRLKQSGVATGSPAAASGQQPSQATPQTHSWSRSAWQKANPGGNVARAESAAKSQGFEVAP